MMRGLLLATFAAILAAAPLSEGVEAATTFMSGSRLWGVCSADAARWLMCDSYIMGIADAMTDAQESGQSVAGWRACLPEGVTQDQTRDIAVLFLEAHPELRPYSAASLVAEALAEAFPCPPP
jgi:hypothetical protein